MTGKTLLKWNGGFFYVSLKYIRDFLNKNPLKILQKISLEFLKKIPLEFVNKFFEVVGFFLKVLYPSKKTALFSIFPQKSLMMMEIADFGQNFKELFGLFWVDGAWIGLFTLTLVEPLVQRASKWMFSEPFLSQNQKRKATFWVSQTLNFQLEMCFMC